MKKLSIAILLITFLLFSSAYAVAEDSTSGPGPAPSSGDGYSDGPEWPGDEQPGPISIGSGDSGQGYGEPAPSSGDGDSDGPGR